MDQSKEQLETRHRAEMQLAEKRRRERAHLPKDVQDLLAEMDAERGPDGETYGFRD